MMKHGKWMALLLALVMVVGLTACKKPTPQPDPTPSQSTEQPTEQPTAQPSTEPSAEPSAEPAEASRIAVLVGPTGIGAAKLLDSVDNDPSALNGAYEYTIANDNSELMAALTKGEVDIAAVASNVAVNLYNKTNGGVKIIALGTQGVLHILEGGGQSTIEDVRDLEGRTVYCVGQGANPEFILRYVLSANGLDPEEDVELVFAEAGEISTKLLNGEIDCAMLPVPAATAALIKGQGQVREAVDVTEAWNALNNGSQLIMTAVVARTEYLEEHGDRVDAFLKDYAASIEYVNTEIDAAAEIVAGYGITPNAAIARKAIPQCHLIYIAGADMAPAISDYFSILYEVSPAAVGGALPDDGIYYAP